MLHGGRCPILIPGPFGQSCGHVKGRLYIASLPFVYTPGSADNLRKHKILRCDIAINTYTPGECDTVTSSMEGNHAVLPIMKNGWRKQSGTVPEKAKTNGTLPQSIGLKLQGLYSESIAAKLWNVGHKALELVSQAYLTITGEKLTYVICIVRPCLRAFTRNTPMAKTTMYTERLIIGHPASSPARSISYSSASSGTLSYAASIVILSSQVSHIPRNCDIFAIGGLSTYIRMP